jgi:hypothetical protein
MERCLEAPGRVQETVIVKMHDRKGNKILKLKADPQA